MTPDAYYYISLAYLSIASLTAFTLCLKGYTGYRQSRYLTSSERKGNMKPLIYVLHSLHIPPYLIASYWYYDAYNTYESENIH